MFSSHQSLSRSKLADLKPGKGVGIIAGASTDGSLRHIGDPSAIKLFASVQANYPPTGGSSSESEGGASGTWRAAPIHLLSRCNPSSTL